MEEEALANASVVGSFQHQPLDLQAASIRLVKVRPLAADGIIRCEIIHTSTHADPSGLPVPGSLPPTPYTCLSYVWGPTSPSHIIMLNDKPFAVRQNLWEFLRIASSRSARKKNVSIQWQPEVPFNFERITAALWIDALCIDQENTSERNHQVQQMGQIFSKAQHVIAWMGRSRRLASLFQEANITWQVTSEEKETLAERLLEFCKHEYWKRAWITQEVQLARSVYFLAHTEAATLDSVLHVLLYKPLRVDTEDFLWLRQNVKDTLRKGTSSKLRDNLWRFRLKNCSDPRDLVYSLLAMSSDADRLQVDYDISMVQLAQDVLQYLYGDNICVWRVATILHVLRIHLNVDEADTGFIEAQALLVYRNHDRCNTCSRAIDLTYPRQRFKLGRMFVHCLRCVSNFGCTECTWTNLIPN
ncbi:hypothetical protein BDW02DRAFT_604326 [Decorospora gaudefroyi]|uniref:Heterokaryon incompatibility domain-containing protein n=1 Tax=Decorospora gaudefroyi TaxID=184978 RepID=A0A6A5L0G1_9PLEO|nr:hypothetical protein BDW02DRAFT_604326 [Decorospora gaudefroyi]